MSSEQKGSHPNFLKRAAMSLYMQFFSDYSKVDPRFYQSTVLNRSMESSVNNIASLLQVHLPINSIQPVVLDVASGTGIVARRLEYLGYSVVTSDLDHGMLTYSKEQNGSIPTVQSNINKIFPFPEDYFDGVVTLGANRFIKNVKLFTEEIYRILRPGGVFIWPINPDEAYEWVMRAGLSQPIKPSALNNRLEKLGFTVDLKKIPVSGQNSFVSFPTRYFIAKK